MARSKPQTEFHISYGAVTLNNNADALLPVLIAPRYAVHSSIYGNAEFASGAIYSGAELTAGWPSATSTAIVDTTTARAVITDPVVALSGGATKEVSAGGIIVFSGAVVGSGSIIQDEYSLRAGDQLKIGDSVYNVLGVEPIVSGASAVLKSDGVAAGASWTATYNGNQSAVYVLTGTSTAVGGSTTLRAVAAIGDPGYEADIRIETSGAAVAVGNYGATLATTSLAGISGSVLVMSCIPGSEGVLGQVRVDTDAQPSAGAATVYTSNFVQLGSAEISPAYLTCTSSGATIAANAQCLYGSGSYPIVSGGVEMNYRELMTEDTNLLLTGAEASAWVGPQVPDNPLGELYKAAAQTGYNDFFVIATNGDTDEAYEESLNVAGKYERAYAIVEERQTPTTIAAAEAVVANYSKPSVAQMKRFWVYSQVKQEVEVISTIASASGTSVTFTSADDTTHIVRGDIITFPSVYEQGEYVSKSAIVKSVNGAVVTVDSTLGTIGNGNAVIVTRKLNHTQLAEAIAADARKYNNSRINYVYAEPNTVAGDYFEDARYIIPVLATMRATMAPHAPLTDVPIPGVAISTGVGFTESDLDLMNDAGVWICYRDERGEMVSRHAITTGGEGTIAEEDSAVSNGDNIVRTVRNQVAWLRGNCNVTPALIDKLYANVQAAFTGIRSRGYDALIGPQILEVTSVDIQQDPNNTAGVIGTFDLDLPDVYLKGDLTFNLF